MKNAILSLALLSSLPASALTLREALERTDKDGYSGRIARARLDERTGQELSSLQGLLPSVRAEGGWSATDDPMNAFGMRLRQRAITMASFDPAALNDPSRASGWNAALVAEVPLVNLDAWKGRAAAGKAVEAAQSRKGADAAKARGATVRAYGDAALARVAVRTWEDALTSAQAHRDQAVSGSRQGTVLRSDSLLAELRTGEIEASLARARSDSALALRNLAFAIGADGPIAGELDELPTAASLREAAKKLPNTSGKRPEEQAVHLESQAAQLDAERVGSSLLPRLNGVARTDWSASGSPFSKDPSWTVGILASWTLHATGEVGERQTARARAEQARTAEAMVRTRLDLEDAALQSSLDVALRRLDIAEAAVAQATEAHRLTTRRYQEGLATMAETLQSAALETGARLSLDAARHDAFLALSDLTTLRGFDSGRLASLSTDNQR